MNHAAIAIGLIMVALAGTPAAAPQSATPDIDKLGPQIGTRVPDFTLRDQNGREQTLRSITGPKGAILVFFRSADW